MFQKKNTQGGFIVSQMHSSIASILSMLDRGNYTKSDVTQALADLEAMKENISSYQYKNVKALLEAKL